MNTVYKVISQLKHDGVLYMPGQIIQDIEGLESLVEAGVLKLISSAEAEVEKKPEPAAEKEAAPSNGDEQPEKPAADASTKPAPFPVVGAGDQDPDETKKADPDTGANL